MHTVSYKFLMKPEESVECHQTLSSWVGSGHEATWDEATAYVLIANEGGVASEHVHLMICYCLQSCQLSRILRETHAFRHNLTLTRIIT